MRDRQRVVGVCARCGSMYAARRLADGSVRPIGTSTCSCGSGRFHAAK